MACYLRFLPRDYHLIASVCRARRLLRGGQATFHRRLAGTLAGPAPTLAWRLALLRPGEVRLLYEHFLGREAMDSTAPPAAREELTAREKILLREVCFAYPLLERFVRAWKPMLLEMLQVIEPGLARKIGRMEMRPLEALVRQVMQGKKGAG